ncbi:kinase/pyrophosphorylase [Brachybacterium sp. EF45031]|uniref:pyruvate, water dikinase regulatory protein n=1 Tax=Brachybacterium sillae TaxID=2810536 RepID=UPI00217E9F51|nr:pyruvate, water dikinase regulatory protein [Brachybacterium sillae]MCS6711885.1 kinase/pyrophosphorylase [Brachybacterium sillae]
MTDPARGTGDAPATDAAATAPQARGASDDRADRAQDAVPVYFLSDSTGISAETMGNALLLQFPDIAFERHLIPFITTLEEARRVVTLLDRAMDGPVQPVVFMTAVDESVRTLLQTSRAPIIDFVGSHLQQMEQQLGRAGDHAPARLHGVGNSRRYNQRMAAVEFAIEHDDGQSLRALEKADIILIAPSRCGKTPTSMYLALQHGVFVANYPLVDEDFDSPDLPRPLRGMEKRCFGLLTSPQRLSEVRNERRPGSRYASLQQTTWELNRARALYQAHNVPFVDSSSKSVEEMATIILQAMPLPPR